MAKNKNTAEVVEAVAWKDEAFKAFCKHAKKNKVFTTEEVRAKNANLPKPSDPRAWGGIALRAKREGIVKHVGWISAIDPVVHGNVVSLWQSTTVKKK